MKFYIPRHGELALDAQDIPGNSESDPLWFVEQAAEYCYDNYDGWEWLWPVIFVVVDDDGVEYKFEVEIEYNPVFYASKLMIDGKDGVKNS